MESIFVGDKLVLYFLAMLYIIITKDIDERKKIGIIYIFSYIIAFTKTLSFLSIVIILNINLFIYFEFLCEDELKKQILFRIRYKLYDYVYKIFFEYNMFSFLISMFMLSPILAELLNGKTVLFSNDIISFDFFTIASILIIIYTINNISLEIYETYSFSKIMEKMIAIKKWSDLSITPNDIKKFRMVSYIEDKSFFDRQKSYSSFSLEYIRLFLTRKKCNIQKPNCFFICKKIRKFPKRYIRGHSTIEMQLIRTLGIKVGYEKVFRRKIYEILYSKIFFESLCKYYEKYKYDIHHCTIKEYLMYIYVNVANIKIKNIYYKNMLAIWKPDKLSEISDEQWFISILGLSRRKINKTIKYIYGDFLKLYKININKVFSLANTLE